MFKEVLLVFTESFKSGSRKINGCFKEVSRVIQESFREMARMFQKSFKGVSRSFKGGGLRVFERS